MIPDADVLTAAQVRNSIPRVLSQMVCALEASDPRPTRELLEITRSHGEVRFHESYNLNELIAEYRILRRILVEEIDREFAGTVSTREWMALDIAIDIALQQAVISFTDHQREQLKSATDAEAKFLAFLAHDMRNSLNTILLTMNWVEESIKSYGALCEEAEGLRVAREAAMATVASMERLLQAERLRKGMAAKREHVNIATLVQEVVAQVLPGANAKSIEILSRVPQGAELWSDAGLITLILQNLTGNAVKYSERGTVVIDATQVGNANENIWQLSVIDRGKGIAPEKVSTLFEAFTRGDTHGQPGVGLGLFIASQAARLLGSKLEVESSVGAGSTFSVALHDLPAPDRL